jgi:hypothetical protein
MAATLDDILKELQKLNNSTSGGTSGVGASNVPWSNESLEKQFEKRNKSRYDNFFEEKTRYKRKTWQDKQEEKFRRQMQSGDKEGARATLQKTAKTNAASAITQEVSRVANSVMNSVFNILNNIVKRQGIRLEATAQLQNRQIKVYGEMVSKVAGNAMANINGKVLDNAYNALDTVIQGGKNVYMKNLQDQVTLMRRENELRKNTIDSINSGFEAVSGVASFFGPIGSIVGSAVSMIGNATTKTVSLVAAQIDMQIKMQEETNKALENFIGQVEQVTKRYTETSKEVNKIFLDISKSAFSFGRTLFLSPDNLKGLNEVIAKEINTSLAKFNMDYKDFSKMQSSYLENNGGRSSIIGTRESEGMAALSTILGISPDEAASINGALNIFNTSIEDGNQLIYSMSKHAAKMGLNATKYAKDLQKNLKLAEKYQFKGGVKGVMEMSAWAQKMRVDMSSFSGLFEKLRSGNIEDVIQTSARLNVLGGNAALLSDPMSMLYNAYADPEQQMKNVAKMVEGFGTFDKKTGQVRFDSINEQMRMDAIAKSLNMSREDMYNFARQAKKEQVIKSTYGDTFGDKTDFITQNATWSQDKNDWVVKVKDGKGGFNEVKLSDLNGENDERLKEIFPEDKQDQIIDIIKSIDKHLSPAEGMEAAEKNSIAQVNAGAFDEQFVKMNELINLRYEDTKKNLDKYVEGVVAATNATITAQKLLNEMSSDKGALTVFKGHLEWSNEQFKNMVKEVGNNDIWKRATGSVEGFASALDMIADALGGKSSSFDSATLISESKESDYIKDDNEVKKRMNEQMKKGNTAGISGKRLYDILDKVEDEYDLDNYDGMYGADRNWNTQRQGFAHGDFELRKDGEWYVEYTRLGNPVIDNDNYVVRFKLDKDGNVIQDKDKVKIGDYKPSTNVKDAIITPRGTVYTDPEDTIIARKPGGSIDKAEQRKNGTSENLNLTVNGTLTLSTGKQSIDLLDILRNDPNALRELAKEIIVEGSRTTFGGKHQWAPNRYTFGN